MDRHSDCPKDSMGRHIRFQVQWLSGEEVNLFPYDRRIHANTDMGFVIHAVLDSISWPAQYLTFYVGERQFTYVHRMKERQHVLLVDIRQACLTSGTLSPDGDLIINIVRAQPPRSFQDMDVLCICDFPGHGCCRTGRTDELKDECFKCEDDCRSCGNCGICRSGECDHSCCHMGESKGGRKR